LSMEQKGEKAKGFVVRKKGRINVPLPLGIFCAEKGDVAHLEQRFGKKISVL